MKRIITLVLLTVALVTVNAQSWQKISTSGLDSVDYLTGNWWKSVHFLKEYSNQFFLLTYQGGFVSSDLTTWTKFTTPLESNPEVQSKRTRDFIVCPLGTFIMYDSYIYKADGLSTWYIVRDTITGADTLGTNRSDFQSFYYTEHGGQSYLYAGTWQDGLFYTTDGINWNWYGGKSTVQNTWSGLASGSGPTVKYFATLDDTLYTTGKNTIQKSDNFTDNWLWYNLVDNGQNIRAFEKYMWEGDSINYLYLGFDNTSGETKTLQTYNSYTNEWKGYKESYQTVTGIAVYDQYLFFGSKDGYKTMKVSVNNGLASSDFNTGLSDTNIVAVEHVGDSLVVIMEDGMYLFDLKTLPNISVARITAENSLGDTLPNATVHLGGTPASADTLGVATFYGVLDGSYSVNAVSGDFVYASTSDVNISANYSSTVTLLNTNNNLSNIASSVGTLSPAFNKNTLFYTCTLPQGETNVPTITPTLESSFSNVNKTDALTLADTTEIEVTAENGAVKVYKVAFEVATVIISSSLKNENSMIYPNPATESFNINESFDYAEMYNIMGSTVKIITSSPVDVTELPKGLYIVKISSYGKLVFKRIIVE